MTQRILLFVLLFLYANTGRIPDHARWHIKYMPHVSVGKYERVINGYDFDTDAYAEDISTDICPRGSVDFEMSPLPNGTGYVYCAHRNKGIKQICPPGTEVSFKIAGCVNKTTNTTVLPVGSRCASQPCQNGGLCYDFTSADAYLCRCPYPYKGLHCEFLYKPCPKFDCGTPSTKMTTMCRPFTNDMALNHVCLCYLTDAGRDGQRYAVNNCNSDELFQLKCEGNRPIGALPFTNKGFYICPWTTVSMHILSCPLHHVWNDTQKECVIET